MYAQYNEYSYGTAPAVVNANRGFNPHAPAFRGGYDPAMQYQHHMAADSSYPANYQMDAAVLAEQQQQQHHHAGQYTQYPAPSHQQHPHQTQHLAANGHARVSSHGYGNDAHQTSFGSSNTSFSGPSTPAAGGPTTAHQSKRSRYTHNPYASSNASNSEPTSPVMAPAVATSRVPADAAFFGGSLSSHGSNLQSPVYAPDSASGYSDPSVHPIAFSINEQFAQARGALAVHACSPRGRHMLIGALRQQHTDKIQAIFDELAPNVAAVIMDPQGGHVIRTLLEFLNEAQIGQLVEYLTPEVVLTIATSSQNTRRVLQTLFERHRTPLLQPVVDVIALHAIALSTTQQGCIAVMRCLEHVTESQKLHVLNALTPQLAALTMDPYGNYVVQAILQYFPRETACEVIEKAFGGHWVNLSCNKFASNVMEKFIQASTPLTRKTILEELVYNSDALAVLMQDGFGNFVLQQVIDTCTTGPEYRKMAEKVRPLLASSPFGHKIEAKLKSKRFGPPYEASSNTHGREPQSRDANRPHNHPRGVKKPDGTQNQNGEQLPPRVHHGERRAPRMPKQVDNSPAMSGDMTSSRSASNASSSPASTIVAPSM